MYTMSDNGIEIIYIMVVMSAPLPSPAGNQSTVVIEIVNRPYSPAANKFEVDELDQEMLDAAN